MLKVSVIIPLYNKSPYIRRTLDSVFAQTYQDYEIIVVDDGSTDDGPAQVMKYTDSRLRLIRQTNAGPGAARNRGATASHAEYLAFLDADDEWLPGYLQKVMDTRKQHPECEVISSNWIADFSKNTDGLRNVNLGEYLESTFGVRYSGPWKMTESVSTNELLCVTSRFCTSTTSCTKNIFEKYHGFGEDGKYGEDWFLWLKFIFGSEIYFIVEPLALFHDEASGLWLGGAQNQVLELYFYRHKEVESSCPDELKKQLNKWYVLRALQSAHNRLSFGKVDDVYYLLNNFQLMKTYSIYSYLALIFKLLVFNLKKQKTFF